MGKYNNDTGCNNDVFVQESSINFQEIYFEMKVVVIIKKEARKWSHSLKKL